MDLLVEVVKIIDDDEDSALPSKYLVEDLGYEAELITNGSYHSVEELTQKILSDTRKIAVLCDNRLTHGAFANFDGSALVASLYGHKIPSILLTQFSSIDIDTSIRRYRRWMPVMLARSDASMTSVADGLEFCFRELEGFISHSRMPHRTLIEAVGCSTDGKEAVLDAFVPGWDPETAVRFPLSLIQDEDTRYRTIATVQADQIAYLFAEVNIGATRQEDLFFDKFEWVDMPGASLTDFFI